jgi:DNA replication protein DnaC
MSEKIEETLRRLAEDMSKASSQTSGIPETNAAPVGDPDCPHCNGSGYIRKDLPLGHADFGKIEICTCRYGEVRSHVRNRLYSLSNLDELHSMTFQTFNPKGRVGTSDQHQASLSNAYDRARAYCETLKGWVLIYGPYGSGKTHLAAAIGNECVTLGVPTLFLTVPDLLDTLRFAFDAEDVTFEERFDQIRQAPLLILDDFGTQSATEWAKEKLFQILNMRYINQMPLVVTTNLALEQIEGRIRSRLSDRDLVTHISIGAPDYRLQVEGDEHHELSSLALHGEQTFGTFNLRKGEKLSSDDQKSLEDAFQAAVSFAENPSGWLVLMGTYGCGKTHLAAATANYRLSQGYPAMFVVVPDLLDHLRATFSPNSTVSYDRRFEEVRTAHLLVLDDLGTQAMTPWVREKLYQLFNYRYNAKLPTVITTSDSLDEIDPRLRARMGDRRLVHGVRITVPSYRGRKPRRKTKS